MTINNYLIIDFGNSYIKAAIFDKNQDKIIEFVTVAKTTDAKQVIDQFSCLKNGIKIDSIIESNTCKPEVSNKFNDNLKLLLNNIEIRTISRPDFNGIIDMSNIQNDVVIGSDILLLAFYGLSTMKKGVIFSLGTVYFGVVFDNNQIINVLLTPSLVKGLEVVAAFGAIDKSMIPTKFDKTIGLNTPDAFASGANFLMEGYVDNIAKQYNFASSNVLITGGDTLKYHNISQKYKYEQYLVLIALANFIKAKSW